ncbi:MAG: hypothetical protein R2697_13965 [Ilumatobacteraceae bacterium]
MVGRVLLADVQALLRSGRPEVISPRTGNQPRHAAPAVVIAISAFRSSGRSKNAWRLRRQSVDQRRVDPVSGEPEEPEFATRPIDRLRHRSCLVAGDFRVGPNGRQIDEIHHRDSLPDRRGGLLHRSSRCVHTKYRQYL